MRVELGPNSQHVYMSELSQHTHVARVHVATAHIHKPLPNTKPRGNTHAHTHTHTHTHTHQEHKDSTVHCMALLWTTQIKDWPHVSRKGYACFTIQRGATCFKAETLKALPASTL